MKRRFAAVIAIGATTLALIGAIWVGGASGAKTPARQYVVLAESNASPAAFRAAIRASGGRVVRLNTAIGLATVVSTRANFARRATATRAVRSVGRDRPIGRARLRSKPVDAAELDRLIAAAARHTSDRDGDHRGRGRGAEPLADLQWDMTMIGAHRRGSQREERGDKKVLVGVIDTGVDGTHPDLAANFDAELSRNFTTDIPGLDNGCGTTPAPCVDPANQDGESHGTHVAGTIAAANNDLGIAGVAPKVTLVNLRAGQDSGFFFLEPTLAAMTYAADNGIDVVNMSYFTDPWLFNCRSNPADSVAERAEQALVIDATQRAADYARSRGVTLVSALGNEATDMDNPTFDDVSPDYPGPAKERTIDNSCLNVPAETGGVISVTSIGPSGLKSDFSNYGLVEADIAAPGGFFRDFFGTDKHRRPENMILSTYPAAAAQADGVLNPDGTPNDPFVIRDCNAAGVCGYYQYLQGTSMASPHVAGVAALIVSKHGSKRRGKGITLAPTKVEQILKATATDVACPVPPTVDYTQIGRPASWTATCTGTPLRNAFYGEGVVNALAAVGGDEGDDDDERGGDDD